MRGVVSLSTGAMGGDERDVSTGRFLPFDQLRQLSVC